MLGADGANSDGVPVPNLIADSLRDHLSSGVSRFYINALVRRGGSPEELNGAIEQGLDLKTYDLADESAIQIKAEELVRIGAEKIQKNVCKRREKLDEFVANEKNPWLYVIVATGNIYEDVKQARAAAMQGADIVAVIRTTAQSLLDYVPSEQQKKGSAEPMRHRKTSQHAAA